MKKFLTNNLFEAFAKTWPVLILVLLNIIIAWKNYTGGMLIGWDNLVPEFNLPANIERSIFAVWQQYQGLGLLGGMGHASDLVHQLILFLLSLALPLQVLRYTWTFLMLFLGSVGAYFLLKEAILRESQLSQTKKQSISLIAGAFYLLNLSTVQTFYAPFEAFTAHFAALPWLLLGSILFFLKPNFKNGILLILILLLATPASYIPTLFVVYMLSLCIILSPFILKKLNTSTISSFIKMLLLVFMANSFWLIPFIYFTLTNSQVSLSAKINEMSTQNIFLQNKAFGDFLNVVLLKGFWFNNVDPNFQAKFTYMMAPWRDFFSNAWVTYLGYLIFSVIIVGIADTLRKKKTITIGFFLLFLFSFTMLATNAFPFSWADTIFRKIPLFNEAFRFPFTKFSIVASLSYAVFFALGIEKLSRLTVIRKINLHFLTAVSILVLGIFVLPIFRGNLFYNKERINPPKEYFQVFDYFRSQDPNTRIANFPQPTFWGWEFYNWGYGGSGFLWYGIKQPILDRAFDVWSRTDENYYWELSYALYSRNSTLFTKVLNKYQINWLLVDKNIIYPSSPLSLFYPQLDDLIHQIPSIKKTETFGNIDIYKVSLNDNPNGFVFSPSSLGAANGYKWGDNDKIYSALGNYISSLNSKAGYYPFRSLFSNKTPQDKEFIMTNEAKTIKLQSPLPQTNSPTYLSLSSLGEGEQIIAADFVMKKDKNNLTISVIIKSPEVSLVNPATKTRKNIYSNVIELPLIVIPSNYKDIFNFNINGVKNVKIDPTSPVKDLGTTFLLTQQDNSIAFNGPNFTNIVTIESQTLLSFLNSKPQTIYIPKIDKNTFIEVSVPKVDDNYESLIQPPTKLGVQQTINCDNFNKNKVSASLTVLDKKNVLKLESQQSTACLHYYAPNLIHNQGYGIFIENANQTGRSLHFWILNEDEKFSPIDTYLSEGANLKTDTFVLPPQEKFGRAYSLHFDNISQLNEPTINYLGNVSIYPIPYNFLSSIKISASANNVSNLNPIKITSVEHPNEYQYLIEAVARKTPTSIILSQSYDPAWKAYVVNKSRFSFITKIKEIFPFLFGKEVTNHVLINNWENGWILDNQTQSGAEIEIIYLPQYLEYLGFLFLLLLLLYAVIYLFKNRLPKLGNEAKFESNQLS